MVVLEVSTTSKLLDLRRTEECLRAGRTVLGVVGDVGAWAGALSRRPAPVGVDKDRTGVS